MLKNRLSKEALNRVQVTAVIALITVMTATLIPFFAKFGFSDFDKISIVNSGIEVGTLLASILLLASCLLDKRQSSRDRHLFLALVLINYLEAGLDLLGYFVGGKPEYRTFMMIAMVVMYALNFLLGYVLLDYMITYLDLCEERVARTVKNICAFFMAAGVFFSFLNLWFPVFFWIDENGIYSRTIFYPFGDSVYVVMVTLMGVGLAQYYKRRLTGTQITAVFAYALIIDIFSVSTQFMGYYISNGINLVMYLIMYIRYDVQNASKGVDTERELNAAKKIQDSMLPKLLPNVVNVPEYDLYAVNMPAEEVGGNFYDFFALDDENVVLVVGDVVGKGVGAALFMAVIKTMIDTRCRPGVRPSEVLFHVNKLINESNVQKMSVGIWLGFLNKKTGLLIYVNAGLGRQAFLKKDIGDEFEFRNEITASMLDGQSSSEYRDNEVMLLPGDRLFLFTEGVPLAKRNDGREFGYKALLDVLNQNKERTSEELCLEMKYSIERFTSGAILTEDITMLGFTFRGAEEGS